MTELVKGSTGRPDHAATVYAANLLRYYGFELEHETIEQLLSQWLEQYSIDWVRLAIVESLYQGRYKAISVGQILALWQRRGQPLYHFNHEFERLVCDRFPRNLLSSEEEDNQASPPLDPGLRYRRVPFQPAEPIMPFSQPHSVGPPQPIAEERFGSVQPSQTATEDPFATQSASGDGTPEATQSAQSSSSGLLAAIAPSAKADPPIHPPAEVTEVISTLQEESPTPTQMGLVDAVDSVSSVENGNQPVDSTDPPPQAQTKIERLQQLADFSNPKVLLPCLGLSNKSLKPKLRLHLTTLYQPNWLISSASKHPIHQFTPLSEASDFYIKLKAVANPLGSKRVDG
jgi:hypothetical protein